MINIPRNLLLICMMLCTAYGALAQDSSASYPRKKLNSKLNSSSEKLEKSIRTNNSKVAEDYYEVAQELVAKEEYQKAESYFLRAIEQALLQKNTDRLALYYRELAKLGEILKKTTEAAANFEQAAIHSKTEELRQLNLNDAKRLKAGSPEKELKYLNDNAEILTKGNNKQEQVQNFKQMADNNIRLKNPAQALENYKQALIVLDSVSDKSNEIKSNIAGLYAEKNEFSEAIRIQKEVVQQSVAVESRVQQMRKLSDLYFASNNQAEGLYVLKDAYRLAVEKGSLKEARASLDALAGIYRKAGKQELALTLHRNFLDRLDTLIARDSSLVDIKLFQFSEEKISRLEKEKLLKDELISRKNANNSLLIVSVLLLLVLLLIIAKAWHSIRKRNKQIALQSLRREMNPHFLFNSLNSVNQFIANNNEREANKYLTSYSNLMRSTMENSNNNFVSLALELDQITKYLDLEKLRFSDKFDYEIYIAPGLDENSIQVPNMIIQPNLENAIWHGLRYRESKGRLTVKFTRAGHKIKVSVDDNGIGLTESRLLKTSNQKLHESRGLKNVQKRIRLLNELTHADIVMDITEKTGAGTGVTVNIEWKS